MSDSQKQMPLIPDDLRRIVPEMVIAVCVRNNARTLGQTLASINMQVDCSMRVAVVLGDDQSTDHWRRVVAAAPGNHPLVTLNLNAGTPSRARNQVLAAIEAWAPSCRAVARLDGDDYFVHPHALRDIENALSLVDGDHKGVKYRALLGGNIQVDHAGNHVGINMPEPDLMQPECLLRRLERMTAGDGNSELPSCNVVLLAPDFEKYPDLSSAEDHALVAKLLARGECLVVPDLLIAAYRLSGTATQLAHRSGKHQAARLRLFEDIRSQLENMRFCRPAARMT